MAEEDCVAASVENGFDNSVDWLRVGSAVDAAAVGAAQAKLDSVEEEDGTRAGSAVADIAVASAAAPVVAPVLDVAVATFAASAAGYAVVEFGAVEPAASARTD